MQMFQKEQTVAFLYGFNSKGSRLDADGNDELVVVDVEELPIMDGFTFNGLIICIQTLCFGLVVFSLGT